MKIGIVGKGKFGKKLYSKFKKFGNIQFFTGKDLNINFEIDWVVIASSNNSHFNLVKLFLNKKINVFCEKPLTLSYKDSKLLFELAEKNKVKLYIDNVFLYRKEYIDLKNNLKFINSLKFTWEKHGSFNDNIYNNLMYHDIYMILDLIRDFDIDDNFYSFDFIINKVNYKKFKSKIKNVNLEFEYNRLSSKKEKIIYLNQSIFDFSLSKNDALEEMISDVLEGNVNFEYNKKLHLSTQKILDNINQYKPKTAIIGGGIFGITSALNLDRNDFDIDLFEKNNDILEEASSINQYRLHRGYHYPRSFQTALSSKQGTNTFLKEYNCVSSPTTQYYAIASNGSKINSKEFIKFMEDIGLNYKITNLEFVKNVESIFEVEENLFNPTKLYKECTEKIDKSNINLKLNSEFKKNDLKNYDYIINASYANLNKTLPEQYQQNYQFELCEKPIIQLPPLFKDKGIIIMDGPFMCIDPLGGTSYHVMGHVTHAIHSTNTGKSPQIPKEYLPFLNKGIIKNPKITNIDKFIKGGMVFFKDIEKSKHIGSMFTIRTVLPNLDHNDARPSIVTKHTDKLYSLFSGKISTCVDTSDQLLSYILKN